MSASSNHCAGFKVVAVRMNQCAFRLNVSHLPSSAHVRERNCCSVFAVTMIVDPSRVDSIQRIIHATSADLPIPRPDATANLNISGRSSVWFRCMCIAISRNIFSCHLRGPSNSSRGVPFSPQGKINLTKFTGSSLMFIDQISVINCFSCCGEYFILVPCIFSNSFSYVYWLVGCLDCYQCWCVCFCFWIGLLPIL